MDDPTLRADCAQCAALCCVGLAFDRSELFAFDKAAGAACPHLAAKHRCAIHADLRDSGFAGCAGYDCLGAGQHVVQHLFGGRSWRDDPALMQPMFEAFRAMRTVHELLLLLRAAERLPLTPLQALDLRDMQNALLPPAGWSIESVAMFERGTLRADALAVLRTLRDPASITRWARQGGSKRRRLPCAAPARRDPE